MKAHILIIDDTPVNIDIVTETLASDYEVSVALNGTDGLELAAGETPDLILLDVMMPGIDGYEVCRRLKADDQLKDIPVLFLTALSDAGDEAQGLAAGGIDYITKPFTPDLVKARVDNHVALVKTRRQLLAQKEEVEAGYKALKKLEDMRDGLVQMIVHDMRSPLMGLSMFIELLSETKALREGDAAAEMLPTIQQSAASLIAMVNDLLDLRRLESGEMPLQLGNAKLEQIIESSVENLGALTLGRNLEVKGSSTSLPLRCDASLIARVIANLIGNALKFTATKDSIVIKAFEEHSWITVEIADTGPGIPPEYQDRIFEQFGQVESRREGKKFSSGLGLTFCQLVVIAHGGSLTVESEVPHGSRFLLRLPFGWEAFPAKEANPTAEQALAPQDAASPPRIRMMIVDVRSTQANAIKSFIESRSSWLVTVQHEPETVIAKLKSESPDIVLIDSKIETQDGKRLIDLASPICQAQETTLLELSCLASTGAPHAEAPASEDDSHRPRIAKDMPLQHLFEALREISETR